MTLTTEQIDSAKPGVTPTGRKTAKPYRVGDAGGLFLEVPPSGSKRWRLKYRFAGKENRSSLGSIPLATSLRAASQRSRASFRETSGELLLDAKSLPRFRSGLASGAPKVWKKMREKAVQRSHLLGMAVKNGLGKASSLKVVKMVDIRIRTGLKVYIQILIMAATLAPIGISMIAKGPAFE